MNSGGNSAQLGLFESEADQPAAKPRQRPPPASVEPAQVPATIARLAKALPPEIQLGTSSWSFPGWAGLVYAGQHGQSTLARKGLAAYARHPLMRAVGIDRTYYKPITAEDFAAYAADVPEGFSFLVKAHEATTLARFPSHHRYGAKRGELNDRFFDAAYATDKVVGPAIEGLGDNAGPIVFQLPPQRTADLGGTKGFPERLHEFLSALPQGPHYAVEIRNKGLLSDTYAQALADAGASHCVAIHPKMPDAELQWIVAGGEKGRPGLVVRWMLPAHLSYEGARSAYEPFDRIVEEDVVAREAIAALATRAHAVGQAVIVIINNKAEGSAPLSVARLAEAIDIRLRRG